MVTEVFIPVLDQTGDEVTILAWFKSEGDEVRQGEVLCEVEASKANTEIEAPGSGILRRILIEAGISVPALTVIALIAEAEEPVPEIDPYHRVKQLQPPSFAPAQTPVASGPEKSLPDRPKKTRIFVSPRAKRLAAEHQIDLSTLTGSGDNGRIVEADVQQAIEQRSTPAADRAAQRKADRVSQSWQTVPHFYTTITVDMSGVVSQKSQVSTGTFTDYFIRAVAQTLPHHPALNGHWQDGGPVSIPEIHLGLVVETERGLVIPVLRDVQQLSLEEIIEHRSRLVRQAHAGHLKATAMGLATFTLSNMGAGHIDHFTAIIAPPQVAILSVGSIQPRPVVIKSELTVRPTANFTLGADHRAIDGRQAAAFLETLKDNLERE